MFLFQVAVVKKLLETGDNGESMLTKDQILVLSPYRAQCHVIRQDLANQDLSDVAVTSIVKSQGEPCRNKNTALKITRTIKQNTERTL